MNTWEQKELELSQRHAEILKIRETLLRGTERYYDAQNGRASSFITDYKKAKERNLQLLNDIRKVSEDLEEVTDEDARANKQFSTLKANYWGMVRNVFPVWLEEQCEYEKKHGLPISSRSTHDPNLPRPSPTPRGKSPSGVGKVTTESPRPLSRTSNNGGDNTATTTVPPLDLDFSMGEDLTISQHTASLHQAQQQNPITPTTVQTPKSALSTSGKLKNTTKKVQIKDDKQEKKEKERLKKEAEKRRKDEEKQRKLREKEEKERKKAEEKERKKSARTPRS